MSYFSIIVPVYQTEKYIEQCIKSVLQQDLDDYELLLVNDGATDGSPVICERYASQSSKIRVIHKKNGGLSDARNTGIRTASGKYLLFLDSDDLLHASDALSVLYQKAEDNSFEIVREAMEGYPSLERDGVLDLNDKLYALTGENEPLTVLTQVQNYIGALIKSNGLNTKLLHDFNAAETAKKQLQLNMNAQNVIENLAFELVLNG